ncbi:hypothetical protein GJ744_001239 [Endocarpon pusillum]|uniref:Uncharacterized protein n=1 Tax=Endocarpon pusillum TaxID=364733 RepID=A0A8H7ACT0_9EURO|nr:hypothetical protein GJ744_001239 [Endocarpon pusillum]
MTSPISPSTGQPVNFQTNVNRAKTKRWVEAKSYAYDGDDWGDGDEYEDEDDSPNPQAAPSRNQHAPPPAHLQNTSSSQTYTGQRYGDLPARTSAQFASRSATNPAPIHNRNQPSFDRGDERRAFSTNIGGFEGPYPTAQRSPFPPVEHFPEDQHDDPRRSPQRSPAPLSSLQQGRRPLMDQEPFARTPYMPDNRPSPYSDPRTGPYHGPMPQQGRRSESSGRPSHGDISGGRHSPIRSRPPSHGDIYSGGHSPIRAIPSPLSAVSQPSRDGSPGRSFPPRKSSLSQQANPSGYNQPPMSEPGAEDKQALESPVDVKPLPFIRPADIYKRMAEEKERERRASEESSRRSVDEVEPQKPSKSALNPVQERRSEHGTENMIRETESIKESSDPGQHQTRAEDDGQGLSTDDPNTSTHRPSQHSDRSGVASDTVEQNAETAQMAEPLNQHSQDPHALHHNPSVGFTSVVHQAFDDSQTKVPPTPSSASGNSIIRSNSASASDISPIIERGTSEAGARHMSSTTIKPPTSEDLTPLDPDPLPAPIRPGYRRDSRTPSPGNSPARRPISVGNANALQEEYGAVSASTPTQREPMHDLPSLISRAESPTKGTVRDLAGKFENRSNASSPGRGSPTVEEVSRPSNPRLESFRPSLPGAWNSYTTSTGTSSPARAATPLQTSNNVSQESAPHAEVQEDEIPTAGPPKPREEGYEASGTAFEALAAAGSALSGAFSAVTGIGQDEPSDNEDSTEGSTRNATPVQEGPGSLSPIQEVLSVASSRPPSPPAKDARYEPKRSQAGYFPSPLRASNTAETQTPMRPEMRPQMRPQMLPALSTDNSPQDTENDRLRKEIVRSLTPKSTRGDMPLRADEEPEPVPTTTPVAASSSIQKAQSGVSTPVSEDDESWERPAPVASVNASRQSQSAQFEDEWSAPSPMGETPQQPAESFTGTSDRPLLQKRFSWEASTESVGRLSSAMGMAATTNSPSQFLDTTDSPRTIRASTDSVSSRIPLPSKSSSDGTVHRIQDRPTIIPVTESQEDLPSDSPLHLSTSPADESRKSVDSVSHRELISRHDSDPDPAVQASTPALSPNVTPEHAGKPSLPEKTTSRELSFREILNMNTAQERIMAYNATRQQVARQESGLVSWLQATGSQDAEHHLLLKQNGRPFPEQASGGHAHKPSPSRSKFPRIGASLGGGGQQAHAESNDVSKPSLGSPSSGKLTSQQVQEEGKKLLQSAGKIGGKAGGAAKGLFAKGKNKLRASSSGGDKALLPGRQRSPPVIQIEDAQHSSATATAAPQISPLFPPVDSNSDTWSLSYAASHNISRTTTAATQPPTDKAIIHEQPRYANLGPPEYAENSENSENAVDNKDRLTGPAAPSPQVSAIGSTNHDDIPSRSISEVTRPDEQTADASFHHTHLHRESQTRTDREADAVCPSNLSTTSPHRSRPASPHDAKWTTSLASSNISLRALKAETKDAPATASPGSSYSQAAIGAHLRTGSSQLETRAANSGPGAESLPPGLWPRRSVVSAVSSPSPGPPTSDHNDLSPSITRPSSSPVQQHVDETREVPAPSPATRSPPYEDATPPYSGAVTIDTKEGEAAAERSLLASSDHRQSLLPAYQSPVEEKASPLPSPPAAIIPVSDLSARRREEERRAPSRPFSFIDAHHENIMHRHTASKDSQLTSGTASSLGKELGIDGNESGKRSCSPLYTRPPNEGNFGLHPALRTSNENRPASQNRNLTPPQKSRDQRSLNSGQQRPEQQYRIPGPYGQQFRAPHPITTSSLGGQPLQQQQQQQQQQPPKSAPLAERERTVDYPSMMKNRHKSSEIALTSRAQGTEYALAGIGPPHPAEPSNSSPKPRTGAAKLFRPHSSSKPGVSQDDASDLYESPFKEEKHKERRGNIFRPRSTQESGSKSVQVDSMKSEAGRAQSALEFYQRSPDLQAQGTSQVGGKAKEKEQKLSKKLQRVTASNNQAPTESKKKGAFLRLSGLFGKSGKESIPPPPPPTREEAVQRSAPPQALFRPPPSTAPGRVNSMPYPEQQAHWKGQDQPRISDDRRSNSFRGQTPPVGGYYAPGSQILGLDEKPPLPPLPSTPPPPPPPPRDPDAFIGGRRLSEQRAAEQARLLANFTGPRTQSQAEKPYQPNQPQQPHPTVQPHSAPASTQHFTTTTTTTTTRATQQQHPRATSQRSPPDLRIDTTSSRLNPNRRSQPAPSKITGAVTYTDSGSRGRPPFAEMAPPNPIMTHSNSNPQRHSPYADRTSQHSPYGYGTARGLRKDNLSHAIDLHKRSRSPRNGRRKSFDSQEEELINAQDPANKLGTFSQTHRSKSHPGESGEDAGQEKPWMIDLPVGDDRGNPSGSAANKHGNHNSSSKGAVPPAELQGSRASGDPGSDEEIVMCSTAYPGQEWMPDVEGYGHWGDHV